MPSSPTADPANRLLLRHVVMWGAFMALLVLGVVLWFRFSGRMVPMLDALSGK